MVDLTVVSFISQPQDLFLSLQPIRPRCQLSHHATAAPMPAAVMIVDTTTHLLLPFNRVPPFSFATALTTAPGVTTLPATVSVAVAVAEQFALPHPKPLGQQPPPTLAPHVYHPLAQTPLATTPAIVTPLLTSAVLVTCGGHEVRPQSRPT